MMESCCQLPKHILELSDCLQLHACVGRHYLISAGHNDIANSNCHNALHLFSAVYRILKSKFLSIQNVQPPICLIELQKQDQKLPILDIQLPNIYTQHTHTPSSVHTHVSTDHFTHSAGHSHQLPSLCTDNPARIVKITFVTQYHLHNISRSTLGGGGGEGGEGKEGVTELLCLGAHVLKAYGSQFVCHSFILYVCNSIFSEVAIN